MSKRTEILISGFGGQGVVKLGQIIGQAAVNQGLFTTMLISHGTETRGGYVRSQVVISDAFIDSPVVEKADWFCAFSSVAYRRFRTLARNGVILYDPSDVVPEADGASEIAIEAGKLAEEQVGQKVFANIVFLGVLAHQFEGRISAENFLQALAEKIPRFPEKNRAAFDIGYRLAASRI